MTWRGARTRVQLDNAGGHGVKISVDELNAYCRAQCYRIEFFTQLARSPDVNALDLGTWASMQANVSLVKYDPAATASMEQRIIDAVNTMWEDYKPEKLTKIFNTLPYIMQCIVDFKGGNGYKLPHK